MYTPEADSEIAPLCLYYAKLTFTIPQHPQMFLVYFFLCVKRNRSCFFPIRYTGWGLWKKQSFMDIRKFCNGSIPLVNKMNYYDPFTLSYHISHLHKASIEWIFPGRNNTSSMKRVLLESLSTALLNARTPLTEAQFKWTGLLDSWPYCQAFVRPHTFVLTHGRDKSIVD